MAKTLTKLNQLEYSTTPGSIIVTNATNEQVFVVPGSEGQILGIQSGVPAYGDANTYISFATQLEVDNGIVSDKPISTDTMAGTIIPSVIVGHDIATISNKTIRETVTSVGQSLSNGEITYTDETGIDTQVQVTSQDTLNDIVTGTDGGSFATIPVQIPKLMFDIPSQVEPFMNNFTPVGNVGDNTSWNFNVYHAPIQDDRYKDLNPTIELMRFKRKHSNRTPNSLSSGSRNSKNLFVHPTHNNGIANTGKPYNGGGQYDNNGNIMPSRTTEWLYTSVQPFEKTNIQLDIKEWKGSGTNLASTGGVYPFPASLSDYENLANTYFKSTGTGKTGSNNVHKTEVFAFRLRIDNPDTTDTTKPYIYGEMSEQFKVFPKIGNSGDEQFFYGWKVSRAHYQKNRS